ncbi:MAG: hypothetical protein Q8S21_05315 [Candidatus Paracaedibacteraceae bacterium]|nr:hypothetical protein [Candidatus Paracaedibacteraceae bacterium]
MLKIKFIMAALLALGFVTGGYADGYVVAENAPVKKVGKSARPGKKKLQKSFKLWSDENGVALKGDALKEKCINECTVSACAKSEKAAECSKNCRKDAPLEIYACAKSAYEKKCLPHAKASAPAVNASAKGPAALTNKKRQARKKDGTCPMIAFAIANAAVVGKMSPVSAVEGSPEQDASN